MADTALPPEYSNSSEPPTYDQAPNSPIVLTRELLVTGKRFSSNESRIVVAGTLAPLYYLSRPFSLNKPGIQLHRGLDSSGEVVACARLNIYNFGIEYTYGNGEGVPGDSVSNPTGWGIMKGSRLNFMNGEQRWQHQGRWFVWSSSHRLENGRWTAVASLKLWNQATRECLGAYSRKGWSRSEQGVLRLREGLGEEFEALAVLTAMAWELGASLTKNQSNLMTRGFGQ